MICANHPHDKKTLVEKVYGVINYPNDNYKMILNFGNERKVKLDIRIFFLDQILTFVNMRFY